MQDINQSLLHSPTAAIHWLSWYDVHAWASRAAVQQYTPDTERRVLLTLRDYLAAKGYESFQGWSFGIAYEGVVCRLVLYHRDYQVAQPRSQNAQYAGYVRLYSLPTFTQPSTLPEAYQSVKE